MADTLPLSVVEQLRNVVKPNKRVHAVTYEYLKKLRIVPTGEKLGFLPDACLKDGDDVFLVHELAGAAIPDWVRSAATALNTSGSSAKVLLVARSTGEVSGVKLAADAAQEAYELGMGLVFEAQANLILLFPPGYKMPEFTQSATELGHIPSWLLQRFRAVSGCSEHLNRAISGFADKYERACRKGDLAYDKEARLLISLAENIADGDRRLFFPIDLLSDLRSFERRRPNTHGRDHFFHTFNNLITGYILLSGLFATRKQTEAPDRFIRDKSNTATLLPWELLWAMAALFHDPGYVAEKLWLAVHANLDLYEPGSNETVLQDWVIEALDRAWETEFFEPRSNLVDLYRRCGEWKLHNGKVSATPDFDSALRIAYVDRSRVGHSVFFPA